MRKIKILVFFALLISFGSKAQDSLFFSRTIYSIPESIPTFNFIDTIYNGGGSAFYGAYVTFVGRVNGDTSNLLTAANGRLTTNDSIVPSDTLNPGSSKELTFTVNGDTAPPFEIGPNLVVIWPIITQSGTNIPINPSDSIYINITIYPLGIAESPLAKMYIYQTAGRLNINFGDAENLVQQVRIVDILGQNMYTGSADRSRNIPTAGWMTGVYLCEITTFSGEKRTIKFRLE